MLIYRVFCAAVTATLLLVCLALGLLGLLNLSFDIAQRHATKDAIEQRLFFLSHSETQLGGVDSPWWEEHDGILFHMRPTPDARIYAYCLLHACLHVSYDTDGNRLWAIDTFDA